MIKARTVVGAGKATEELVARTNREILPVVRLLRVEEVDAFNALLRWDRPENADKFKEYTFKYMVWFLQYSTEIVVKIRDTDWIITVFILIQEVISVFLFSPFKKHMLTERKVQIYVSSKKNFWNAATVKTQRSTVLFQFNKYF